ncbi:MAG TPA: S-layer homology domain-containing protein, partial [Pseudoflavonifractor sp.]|nr:S-layer homology domain-containing protein [Pseudoflavonifractor sp.]
GALSGLTGTPTITWEEKDGGSWKTTADTTFQPGKEYRPVVTVTVDGNHKLEVNDNYTINTNKNGQNSAAITTDDTDPGNIGTFIGAPTALPGTPVLKFQDVNQSNASDKKDPATSVTRNISVSTGATLGKYTVTLSNSGEVIYDVYLTSTGSLSDKIALTPATINQMNVGDNQDYTLDLSGVSTSAAFVGQVIITARGAATDGGVATIQATYTLNLSITSGGGGGGGGGATELTVTYDLQGKGTSKDALSETVASSGKPAKVPTVTANKGYTFKGWSQSDPSKTEEPKLVDPKTVAIKADTTFYAVYDGPVTGEHEHYIKGYDTGIFGPADDITRSQVAAIIARACLDGFHEDTDYGNGGYTDVANDHWARSAIAFVTEAGVFEGDGEGHFDPDRPITRQEFALVFARMAGLLEVGETPFSDAATTADWAMAGVYTAYAKGWLDGYNDGTFKPWNNIMRSEAVKIVNRYLNRGVNAEGIVDVYSELKQWSDVPSTYWAYYEILEASNDHTYFYADGVQPPEVYTKAYIEEASWGK